MRAIPRAYRVYDVLTDQLVGEIDEPTFKRFVADFLTTRKDNGALDGTPYGFPDRAIYVPDAWDEARRRHMYPR